MKKILYSVMAMAALTFSFTSLTSCEDVPAPYEIPGGEDNPDTPDTPGEEPAGTGTQADPFNVAGALKYIENGGDENTEVYVKGKVVSVVSGSYDASYGSLKYYISDDGTETNQFYVFNGYAGPNRTKFSGEDALKAGDEVVICGKLVTYNGTKEFTTGNYVVSINGNGGSDQPATGDNDGTEEKPYTAKEAIAKATATNVFVKAYIVGCVNDKALSSASFDASNFTSETNILVAASVDEKDVNNCLPVQLPSGKVREGLNLKANASNYKKEVLLYGNIEKYFGAVGIKSVTYAKIGVTELGTKPSGSAGGDTPSGSEILNESFASGIGTFTIKDVNLSSGLTYVWKHDDSYKYMKASAYAGSAKASESWLVSGKLDLSKVKNATLTFDQALNHLKSQKRADYVNVLVSTDYSGDVTKATWTELSIEGWPTTDSWTMVSSKASMNTFAGKSNVYIAFKYTSNTSYAPTWEIKNVVIK